MSTQPNGAHAPIVSERAEIALSRSDWSDKEKQKLLKNTVAAGTTDVEFAMFRELCIATGLNPFRREIWCIVTESARGRQVQIMTGINGYFQVANSHPQFDGLEWEVERTEKGALVSATAKVWRKDRRLPSVGRALWKEFSKPYGNWKSMEEHMLLKCAKAIALREAFPQELGGTYTEDEMPSEFSAESVGKTVAEVVAAGWNEKKPESTYKHFALKHGTKSGTLLSEITNQKHLENHLHKYREQYGTNEQEAISLRITELKRLYAQSQDESLSMAVREAAARRLNNGNGGTRATVSDDTQAEQAQFVETTFEEMEAEDV
jgi:phage recombination protein Bet